MQTAQGTSFTRKVWEGCKKDIRDPKKSSFVKYISIIIFFVLSPFLLIRDILRSNLLIIRRFYTKFGIAGFLVPPSILLGIGLIGGTIWYCQPVQKVRRNIHEIDQAGVKLEQKRIQMEALMNRYTQEIRILQDQIQVKMEVNGGKPDSDRICELDVSDLQNKEQNLRILSDVWRKLVAGEYELIALQRKIKDDLAMKQVLNRREIEAISKSIGEIIQKHSPEEGNFFFDENR